MADHFQPARAKDLRAELGFDKKDRNFKGKKSALRKIVANMSLNSAEMVGLFPDVVACLGLNDLEIKRLSALYLETYAKTRPEMATRALPVLVDDTRNDNPLIRSLALRTVSTIPIQAFIDETLRLCKVCAKDDDPLVRVAAVYAMAKIWAYDRTSAESAGFQRTLNQMLNDKHPRVSATAVSCLLEVAAVTPGMTITINYTTALHLVKSLVKCNEWCQVYVLRILQYFVPTSEQQASELLTHSFSRIQHANTAVVLASIRLTIYLLNFISDYLKVVPNFDKLFQAPFALLMSKPPQLQYIMLRNLIILQQSHPVLVNHVDARNFFSAYNDTTYVKTSKIEVLYGLANPENALDIINEFYSCAAEVDIEASRKAIHSLGRLCLKLPQFADNCVAKLMEILQSGAPYIVQEVTIALQSIMRKFPDRYAREFIPILSDCRQDIFDDENAKVAFLWLLGQYPLETTDTSEVLAELISSFGDEPLRVQLATLTASIKLFIAHPQSTKDIIPRAFEVASEEGDDPDLRDRAFMYWRLLSHEPHKARDIVNAVSTEISNDENQLQDSVLEELDHSLGYLSSLYLKSSSRMFRVSKPYELPQSPCLVPRNKYKGDRERNTDNSATNNGSRRITTGAQLNYNHQAQSQSERSLPPHPPPTRQMTSVSIDANDNHQGYSTPMLSESQSPFVDGEKLIDI